MPPAPPRPRAHTCTMLHSFMLLPRLRGSAPAAACMWLAAASCTRLARSAQLPSHAPPPPPARHTARRLQYTINKGVIQTPELLQSLELPSTVSVMGQSVDITPLNQLLEPLLRNAEGLAASVSDVLAQTASPSLELPNQASSWQLNTFVDDSLRITRGDGGAVFVFQKK